MIIVPGSEDDVPGEVTINPRGNEAREKAKWEQFDTEFTRRVGITGHFRPGNPPESRSDNQKEYPKMLYIALQSPLHGGQWKCMTEPPLYFNFQNEDMYLRALAAVEHFNTACQRIVGSRLEEEEARKQGYCTTQAEAMAWRTGARMDNYIETGHREWDDRNMGEKAKAEKQAYEAAHPGNQPEIPEQRLDKSEGEAKALARVAELEAQLAAQSKRKKPGPKPKAVPESVSA